MTSGSTPQRNSWHASSPSAVTEMLGGLSGFGVDEVYEPRRRVPRTMSGDMKKAKESLEYSEFDLELITGDDRQFEVLKQSLRKKGAVTNEVLKQKLPLYLKFKKDRLAQSHPEVAEALRQLPGRTNSGRMPPVERVERQSVRKPVNRVLSSKEQREINGTDSPQNMIATLGGTLTRITRPGTAAQRITRPGARSRGGMTLPQRTKSSGNTTAEAFFSSEEKERTPVLRTKSAKM